MMGRIAERLRGGNSEKKNIRARTSRASMLENAHTYREKVDKEVKGVRKELEAERSQLAGAMDPVIRQNLARELGAAHHDRVMEKVTQKEGELHRIEKGIRKNEMPDIDKEIKRDIKAQIEGERGKMSSAIWQEQIDQKIGEIRGNGMTMASLEQGVLQGEYLTQLKSIQDQALAQKKAQFQTQHGYPAEGQDLKKLMKTLRDPALVSRQKAGAWSNTSTKQANGELNTQMEQAIWAEATRKVQEDPVIKDRVEQKVGEKLKEQRKAIFDAEKKKRRNGKVAERVEARIAEIAEKRVTRLVDKEIGKLAEELVENRARIIAEGRVAKQFKEDQHKVLEAYEQEAIKMGPTSSPRSLRYRWLDRIRHPLKYRESQRDMVIARWEDMKNLDVLNKRLSMGDDAELVLHSMGMSRATSTQKALEEAKEKLSALDVRMKALMGPEMEAISQKFASTEKMGAQNPFVKGGLRFDDDGDLLPGKSGERGGSNRNDADYVRMQNMRNIVMYLNHQQSMALDVVRVSKDVSSSISDRKKAIFERASKMVEQRQRLREQLWKERMELKRHRLEARRLRLGVRTFWRDTIDKFIGHGLRMARA